ncbi:MAG: succinate--CoA ligase subunit alpha [Comamonadaceae bacterium]|nr:succinate--CoA ligase subunit alpha [Comamonadaceae bacterium]
MSILLDEGARVVLQGTTGGYGLNQMRAMKKAGTNVVALASAGRGGQVMDGIPVFDTLVQATQATGANAVATYVPAAGVRDALVEAADAGLNLMVVGAEFVPVQDALWGLAYARERDLWVVGPNCVGLTSPGKAALGSIPPDYTMPGAVGLMGRSGTLSLTTVRLLTRAGLGQTTCVSMGGDMVIGRNPVEYLQAFMDDAETQVIVSLGEIGGGKEYQMLDAIAAQKKPVVCLIVGRHAPANTRMGHAGAFVSDHKSTAMAKREALAEAGAIVADSPFQLVEIVRGLLLDAKTSECAVT